MTTKSKGKNLSSVGLQSEMMLLAQTDFDNDRRSEQRLPFFRAVSIQFGGALSRASHVKSVLRE